MSEIVCPWCTTPVSGTTSASKNWYCRTCRRYDGVSCLVCGMTEGFPRKEPWVAQGDLAKSPLNGTGDFSIKQYVYCEWDFHNAYFVVQNGDILSCPLCGTSWDRFTASVHAPAVAMRAG